MRYIDTNAVGPLTCALFVGVLVVGYLLYHRTQRPVLTAAVMLSGLLGVSY